MLIIVRQRTVALNRPVSCADEVIEVTQCCQCPVPRFGGDDDALCAVSPTSHHLHAEIILPAVTDSHLCFQFSHPQAGQSIHFILF